MKTKIFQQDTDRFQELFTDLCPKIDDPTRTFVLPIST